MLQKIRLFHNITMYSVLASSLISPPESDDPSPGGEKCVHWLQGRLRQDPFRIRRTAELVPVLAQSTQSCIRFCHVGANDCNTSLRAYKIKVSNIKYVFGCSEHKLLLVQRPGNKVGWRKH